MTPNTHAPRSRRAFIGWMATAAFAGLATQATARNSASPADRITRHYSLKRFTALDRNGVYRLDHAARRGAQITIGDLSPSASRQLLRDAVADWPATRAALLR